MFALPRADWPLVLAGALLLVFAYPPFHIVVPSFTCLIPVAWLLQRSASDARPARRRIAQGFWYGLLANGFVLYWMIVALWHYTPLSGLGYLATIVSLGLFDAGLFGVAGWIVGRTRVPLVLVLPACWTALEWGVGHLGDVRFPWLGLGTSLTGFPVLVQIADVVGARGVTFLLVMANVALATALPRWREPKALRTLGIVGTLVVASMAYGAVRARQIAIRPVGSVALVQPNIGFREKWDGRLQDSVFDALVALSQTAIDADAPRLIVWPEAAVPGYLRNRPDWEGAMAEQARAAGAPILAGALDYERFGPGPDEYDYWNAAFLIGSDGRRAPEVYHKRYLVPITERVPFVNPRWFNIEFFGGFAVGARGPLFTTGVGRFGVIICYESVFEDLTRDYRARGADFLVNITNDAWFGHTSAPRQHLAHLVMRAIETRAGIARAGNNGISGFVDPLGRITDRTRLGETTFTVGPLVTSDVRTIYTRLGDWVGLLSVTGTILLVSFAAWRRTA